LIYLLVFTQFKKKPYSA